jgi:hypothetical protein
MSLAAVIRRMADAGAPPEAIAIAVEAIEAVGAKDAERRAKQAERKRRSRDSHADVTGQSQDNPGHGCDAPQPPPKDPVPQNTPPIPPTKQKEGGKRATAFPADFEPNDVDLACFAEQGIQTSEERGAVLDHWRDHHVSKGNTFKDWHASLRTWLRSPYRARAGPAQVAARSSASLNGASHHNGTHRQPSYRDIADADIARLERESELGREPMLRIASR